MERTLLLVDDEENILAALYRVLRRDGYRILKAGGGRQGLALLEEHEVGVIISDQRMPEMTGVEFLSRVKELYPGTVRIVLSGYTDLKTVTDAINQGAIYKFLTKPWDDDLLRANVEEAFRHYELKRENERLTRELQRVNEQLLHVNRELERRVEERTRELTHNLHVLQVSQEVLEHLPYAVLGFDDDGLVVAANRTAHELLGGEDDSLVGRMAWEVLPEEIHSLCATASRNGMSVCSGAMLARGWPMQVCCARIGRLSSARGWVVVMVPAQGREGGEDAVCEGSSA